MGEVMNFPFLFLVVARDLGGGPPSTVQVERPQRSEDERP